MEEEAKAKLEKFIKPLFKNNKLKGKTTVLSKNHQSFK